MWKTIIKTVVCVPSINLYHSVIPHTLKTGRLLWPAELISLNQSATAWIQDSRQPPFSNQKVPKGAVVIAASMHGFANCWKFKSPVTLTLTLDRVKVTSACTIPVGLPAKMPTHLTVASHSTEIWQISHTFCGSMTKFGSVKSIGA